MSRYTPDKWSCRNRRPPPPRCNLLHPNHTTRFLPDLSASEICICLCRVKYLPLSRSSWKLETFYATNFFYCPFTQQPAIFVFLATPQTADYKMEFSFLPHYKFHFSNYFACIISGASRVAKGGSWRFPGLSRKEHLPCFSSDLRHSLSQRSCVQPSLIELARLDWI